MTARRKARKRALDLLYEAEIRGVDPLDLLVDRLPEGDDDYATALVRGVVGQRERIDELLDTHSHGWPLDRMPAVDRTILRIGVWELLWNPDVPDAVVIDEAVALAGSLSTDDSPAFVNGLLGRIEQIRGTLVI